MPAAATGGAIWLLGGVVPGMGARPKNCLAFLAAERRSPQGRQVSPSRQSAAGNSAIPPTTFWRHRRLRARRRVGLRITARGMTGPSSNDKRAKLWFDAKISAGVVIGGSVIADTGPWVDTLMPNNNVGWQLTSNVFKLGAAGSNTQYGQGSAILGGIHGGMGLPAFPTAIEAGVIVLALTGSSYTSAAANDLLANWFEVSAMN